MGVVFQVVKGGEGEENGNGVFVPVRKGSDCTMNGFKLHFI